MGELCEYGVEDCVQFDFCEQVLSAKWGGESKADTCIHGTCTELLLQDFKAMDLLPNTYAIAATAVVPSLLSQTSSLLAAYGILGELVHVGGIGGAFALFV